MVDRADSLFQGGVRRKVGAVELPLALLSITGSFSDEPPEAFAFAGNDTIGTHGDPFLLQPPLGAFAPPNRAPLLAGNLTQQVIGTQGAGVWAVGWHHEKVTLTPTTYRWRRAKSPERKESFPP